MDTAASYSRCVKRFVRCADRSPRVYYTSIGLVLTLLVSMVSPVTSRALAQVELTWAPSMVKGPAGAPVTIVEFSDYQCPYCQLVQQSLTKVLQEYDGRVRLVFKDRPLAMHTLARPAHEAARCAGAAGKYWPYHDRLFAAQPAFRRADLLAYAGELGLDREAFARCLDERRFASEIDQDIQQAQALGINSTPTFLINGRIVIGATSIEEFRSIIDQALQERR
jgi:protein-disulfide isomerase